jgi:hypothetical protein
LVPIYDGRTILDQLTLDQQGSVLRHHETAVSNFFDPAEVRSIYYPEVEQLIRETAGAEKAVAFEHDMRCASKVRSTGITIGLASLSLEMMREMLTEIYDWFTEGFDTLALEEARSPTRGTGSEHRYFDNSRQYKRLRSGRRLAVPR